jgi:NAD(P)H-binding
VRDLVTEGAIIPGGGALGALDRRSHRQERGGARSASRAPDARPAQTVPWWPWKASSIRQQHPAGSTSATRQAGRAGAKEAIIQQSSLEWVIVRPPRLTNGRRTGAYRTGTDVEATMVIPRVSRTDLSDFKLDQLAGDTYLRETPAIMY